MTRKELESRLAKLETEVAKVASERDDYRQLYLVALERIKKLEAGLVGPTKEKLSPNDAQLSLAVLEMLLGAKEKEAGLPEGELTALAKPEIARPSTEPTRRKPKGRKRPDPELMRIEVEVLPPEVERKGRDAFEKIGEDRTEVLERRRGGMVVVSVVKPKFVPKERPDPRTGVLVEPTPELPIPKGIAGPGLLADTIVRRWQDHLPLHRLEDVYAREGAPLARSTMCGWHERLADLASPLVEAMHRESLEQPYVCVDATGVLVQAKEKCRRAHFWVLVAPGLHVLFRYSRRHDSAAVDDLLPGYEGYLVSDAHSVYDHLYRDGPVVEVGCWSHARRYFFKALGTDPERARAALALINALFRLERSLANAPRRKKEAARRKKAKPLVDQFFEWCEAEKPNVLDETPIQKGIQYATNQKEALCRFLEDGRLPLHNNISEQQLRRQAIGRKNWLFVGSDEGAEVNAVFTSLLASCRMHGVEPWEYLRDLFCLLPRWPRHRVLTLAPAYWEQTREQRDTQERLAADPYRRVLIELERDHRAER